MHLTSLTKGEILVLHATLFQMRRYVEQTGGEARNDYFEQYDALGVSPVAVHLDRHQHTRALELLSRGLRAATRSAVAAPETTLVAGPPGSKENRHVFARL